MTESLKKYGLFVAALAVAFAAGRFTLRTTIEKEVQLEYEKQLTRIVTTVESRFSEQLKESVETIRKEVETASQSSKDVDEKILVRPDGTHDITRSIRSKQETKTNTVIKTEIKVVEVEKVVEKVVVQDRIVEVEKRVEVIVDRQIPPPSWRVYGAAAINDPTGERSPSYGAGTMYDLGPVNVGGFGLYNSDQQSATAGLTLGISF